MSSRILRSYPILVLTSLAAFLLAAASPAQAPSPANPDTVKMFHPTPPLPSYEVATIKQADPGAMGMSSVNGSRGRRSDSGQTIKSYILNAYGASTRSDAQILGGPSWLSTDRYVIQAKVPDDLRDAMEKMTQAEQDNRTHMMQQSLLGDRFHLKAHFEIRQLPVFELSTAKGGLKMKAIPAPTPSDPEWHAPGPADAFAMPPGHFFGFGVSGHSSLVAHAVTITSFAEYLRRTPDIGGRPIIDKTGFTSYFDITDFQYSDGSPDSTLPSLFTALTEDLGLKLTATKGPVEVLVIESIDRPTEN